MADLISPRRNFKPNRCVEESKGVRNCERSAFRYSGEGGSRSCSVEGVRLTQSLMVILLLGYTFFRRGNPDMLQAWSVRHRTAAIPSTAEADVSSSGRPPSIGRSNRSPVCNPPQWRQAQSPLTKKHGKGVRAQYHGLARLMDHGIKYET